MGFDAERRYHEAAAPAERRVETRLARPRMLEPAAPERRGRAEQDKEKREHPAEIELRPFAIGRRQGMQRPDRLLPERRGIAGAGLHFGAGRGCDRARQRQPENAEPISHADTEMNGERGGRHEPAIEAWLGDDAFAVKDAGW